MPIQLHNYDVLLAPNSTANKHLLRFAQGNHIGNQRFAVLLSLFRQRYLQANLLGDEYECLNIAQEVMETVCDKCVPNGRFFEQGRDNRWQRLDRNSPSTLAMICNALKNDITTSSVERQGETPKPVCRRADGFDLLCKAASKKLPAPDEYVESPKPFDVICESNGRQVSRSRDCKHTGNNRLKIMIELRKRSYESSELEGKIQLANEVVSSILDDTHCNFLQQDKLTSTYKLMSRELAVNCVKAAFDTATDTDKKQFRESEVKKLVQRKHKKAILDRLENEKNGKKRRITFSSNNPMPTTFNSFLRHNEMVSKAA